MTHRCINLRDWESRRLLELAAGETAVLVRPVALIDFRPSDTRGYDWSFRNKRLLWNDVSTDLLVDKFCPFGRPGDTLIGREAWKLVTSPEDACCEDWAYAIDGKIIEPLPVGCRATRTGTLPASRTPARFARHRRAIVSVEVKRCAHLTNTELFGGAKDAEMVVGGKSVRMPVSDEAVYFFPPALLDWNEKRFPWATSHAWVLRLGGDCG